MAGRHRKPEPQVLSSEELLDQMAVPAGYPSDETPSTPDVAAAEPVDSTDFPPANPLA